MLDSDLVSRSGFKLCPARAAAIQPVLSLILDREPGWMLSVPRQTNLGSFFLARLALSLLGPVTTVLRQSTICTTVVLLSQRSGGRNPATRERSLRDGFSLLLFAPGVCCRANRSIHHLT